MWEYARSRERLIVLVTRLMSAEKGELRYTLFRLLYDLPPVSTASSIQAIATPNASLALS